MSFWNKVRRDLTLSKKQPYKNSFKQLIPASISLAVLSSLSGCYDLAETAKAPQTKEAPATIYASDPPQPPLSEFEDPYDIFSPVIAQQGMVVSQKKLASDIGADILRQGGNAVDAAVATGFALAVVLPRAGNLAGGGFMLVHLAEQEKTIAIDYRETAPAAAYKTLFLDENQQPITEKSLSTLSASGVPGTVAGLHYVLKKYGTMSWQQVIKPAQQLAKNGFIVDHDMVRIVKREQALLKANTESKNIFFKANGQAYQAGDKFIQADLANSLSYISETGKDGFYQGDIAKELVQAMQSGGGLITAQDLANYQVQETAPIRGTFLGYEILTMPPPSSGGVHLIQMFNMLEALPFEQVKQGSADMIHLHTEIFKRAYADRSTFLGDPNFVDVPVKALTSKAYARDLAKDISLTNITPSSQIKAGKPNNYESPDTTHYSVMDNQGNVVSNTYTLNHYFGNGITIPNTGILLNNTMDDFSAKPGSPNSYGLIGGEANSIAANKRPLSSMTPTIVLKSGKPYLATGTPGGSKIITTVFQQLVNILQYKMNISEATNAPRFHHQWLPDQLQVERNIPADTIDKLTAQGYEIAVTNSLGSLQSIMKHKGVFFGAADPRRPGASAAPVNELHPNN